MTTFAETEAARSVLLTTYMSLMTADGFLALAHRTNRVRHGSDVLSATAGGIIEPSGPGLQGDVDENGMPDPLSGVLRESEEEIGFAPPKESCRPVVVFQSNIRGKTEDTRNDGQLVAVVLYLAGVDMTMAQLESRAKLADPARGRFEQRGLVACPLDSASQVAMWAALNATELDQHGILSCLYASALVHGPAATQEAFESGFGDCPWWARSPYQDGAARLVRDPRQMVPEGGVTLAGPSSWGEAWDGYRLESLDDVTT